MLTSLQWASSNEYRLLMMTSSNKYRLLTMISSNEYHSLNALSLSEHGSLTPSWSHKHGSLTASWTSLVNTILIEQEWLIDAILAGLVTYNLVWLVNVILVVGIRGELRCSTDTMWKFISLYLHSFYISLISHLFITLHSVSTSPA
jgi:hypothetical protein